MRPEEAPGLGVNGLMATQAKPGSHLPSSLCPLYSLSSVQPPFISVSIPLRLSWIPGTSSRQDQAGGNEGAGLCRGQSSRSKGDLWRTWGVPVGGTRDASLG